MRCLGAAFNQENKRTWSRITLNCQSLPQISDTVSPELLNDLHKGTILQYYKNSSQLTKQQRYAQIVKGYWSNRTTTWATQTQDYSNPNTKCLLRTNTTDIIISGDPITASSTKNLNCINPFPIYPSGFFPSIVPFNPDNEPPPIIPPIPPDQSGGPNIFPNIIPVINPPAIVYPDGGSLICSIIANPCTGEIINISNNQLCHPTTDSDIPGPIQLLCYNNGSVENLYIKPATPSVTDIISGDGIVNLIWTPIHNTEYYIITWS